MDKTDPMLGYVSDLVRFANLKPEEVEEFSRLNFLPNDAWGTHPSSHAIELAPTAPHKSIAGFEMWQPYQTMVQDLWKQGFPFEGCLELVVDIDRFSQHSRAWEEMQRLPNEALQKRVNERTMFQRKPETWPIQKAIWFLSVNPWRVRYCKVCARPFAIITSNNTRKQDCCSTDCRDIAATRRKHRWGKNNNWGRS